MRWTRDTEGGSFGRVRFEASPAPRSTALSVEPRSARCFGRVAALSLGIGWAAACLPSSPGPATDGANGGQRPTLAWEAGLPLLPEDKPRSIRYRQATLRWRTATVAFARGDFKSAADSFLGVVKVLRTARPHPHASTFAVARCLAYENAGRALSALGDIDAARTRLLAAIGDDAACPLTVRRTLSGLTASPPPSP